MMTYPPQQPGPYGQPTYGQQPGYPGADAYGGYLGGPGGQPPKKRNTGMIVTVAVVVVLVLAGAAVGIYLLIKDDGGNSAKPGSAVPTGVSPPQSADPSTPTEGGDAEIVRVAQSYAEAVNTRQESTAKELTCDKTGPGVLYQSTASGQKVQVTSRPKMSGSDSAFIDFGVSTSGNEPIGIPILLENNGGWCIAI